MSAIQTCADPPAIGNGYITSAGPYSDGDKVVYSCQSGYSLSGDADGIVCDAATGVWNGTEPSCSSSASLAGLSLTSWALIGLGILLFIILIIALMIVCGWCCPKLGWCRGCCDGCCHGSCGKGKRTSKTHPREADLISLESYTGDYSNMPTVYIGANGRPYIYNKRQGYGKGGNKAKYSRSQPGKMNNLTNNNNTSNRNGWTNIKSVKSETPRSWDYTTVSTSKTTNGLPATHSKEVLKSTQTGMGNNSTDKVISPTPQINVRVYGKKKIVKPPDKPLWIPHANAVRNINTLTK